MYSDNNSVNPMPRNGTALLVLAGESISPRKSASFKSPTWLLNLGHSPAVKVISDTYKHVDPCIFVYVAALKYYDFSSLEAFTGIVHIPISESSSLIDSLHESLPSVHQPNVILNLITTIPPSSPSLDHGIYCSSTAEIQEDWSSVLIQRGRTKFLTKTSQVQSSTSSYPLIGKIVCSTDHLIQAIRQLKLNDNFDDPFLYLCSILYSEYNYPIIHEPWYDLGHQSTLGKTKRSRFTSRYFNSCVFDEDNFVITKTSSNVEKLKAEAEFLSNIPCHMTRFFPILIDSKAHFHGWQYTMEYIPFPTLSELYLYGSLGPNLWLNIIRRISAMFDTFYGQESVSNSNAEAFYSSKLKERYLESRHSLEKGSPLYTIFHEDHYIDNLGIPLPPLSQSISYLINELLAFEGDRPLFIGHGDLCFNNILVEPIFTSIKAIDPKALSRDGSLGLVDPLYDLAKLNHSVCCHYDAITNGLYTLRADASRFLLNAYSPPLSIFISEVFHRFLFSTRISPHLLNILTANLFISMLPLHSDSQSKQAAFALIGQLLIHSPESIPHISLRPFCKM